jgi:hypothetical protein
VTHLPLGLLEADETGVGDLVVGAVLGVQLEIGDLEMTVITANTWQQVSDANART